jgi:hypothetical protein
VRRALAEFAARHHAKPAGAARSEK